MTRFAASGVPLILAGATVGSLTNGTLVYRVCDNEDGYSRWLAATLRDQGLNQIQIVCQTTRYGEALARALNRSGISDQGRKASACLLIGQADWAERVIAAGNHAGRTWSTIVLTDDAQHPRHARSIARITGTARVLVAGFSLDSDTRSGTWALIECLRRWNARPGAFFWETIASIEVAATLNVRSQSKMPYRTILGPIRFDMSGEARPQRFRLYELCGAKLCPVREATKYQNN